MDALARDVEACPDAYQYERAVRLGVSVRCVGYALKRLGVTYKKSLTSSRGGRRQAYSLPENNLGA